MCHTGMRRVSVLALGAVCGLLITACGASRPSTAPASIPRSTLPSARIGETASPTSAGAAPSGAPRSGVASADYAGSGTAHGCGPEIGAILTVTVEPDGLRPSLGCLQLKPGQRLRVVNNTNGYGQRGSPVSLKMRGLPTISVLPGRSAEYPKPISAYLGVGQHYGTCSSEPGSRFDLWVLA
jgi:hypothetical protein